MNRPNRDTLTPCQEHGFTPGTLVIVDGDRAIPDGSLCRVVFDDEDKRPAVEVLIPLGELRGSRRGAATVGGAILKDSYDAEEGKNIAPDIQDDKEYYWVDVNDMQHTGGQEND